jgi:hypothetical protein
MAGGVRFSASKPNLAPLPQAGRALGKAQLRAANKAVDRASRVGQRRVRQTMKAMGLGKLERVVGHSSSLKKGVRTDRPWGVIFAKGQSKADDRGAGALDAYSEGAIITPKANLFGTGWLWIPQPAIPKRIRRYKATPALYNHSPLVHSIGPLIFIKISSNRANLIVKKVKVSPKTGRAKALGVRKPRTGIVQDSIIAFKGIKITRRMKRFDQKVIMRLASQLVPKYVGEELDAELSRRP